MATESGVGLEERRLYAVVAVVSSGLLATLLWLIYGRDPSADAPGWTSSLPLVNASLNSATAVCLIAGYRAIRRANTRLHRRWMSTALVFSSLFLLSYVTYHHFHGDTRFTGEGPIRATYFFVLVSHILTSMIALPMVLTTVYFAASARFERHRRLARWTLPLWLYVSVTGVLVFALLRFYG